MIATSLTGWPDCVQQRVAALLRARERVLVARQFEHPADAHGAILVQEIVAAALLDAEQQVQIAGKRGRLAGLVQPEHDMQVGPELGPRAEVDRLVGELAIADEIKAPQPHCEPPALRRAVTRSAPLASTLSRKQLQPGLVLSGKVAPVGRKVGDRLLDQRLRFGTKSLRAGIGAHGFGEFEDRISDGLGRFRPGWSEVELELFHPSVADLFRRLLGFGQQQVLVADQ